MQLQFISRRNFEILLISIFVMIFAVINYYFEVAVLPLFVIFTFLFLNFRIWINENISFVQLNYEYKIFIIYITLSLAILQLHAFEVFYGIFEVLGDAAYNAGYRLGYSVNGVV